MCYPSHIDNQFIYKKSEGKKRASFAYNGSKAASLRCCNRLFSKVSLQQSGAFRTNFLHGSDMSPSHYIWNAGTSKRYKMTRYNIRDLLTISFCGLLKNNAVTTYFLLSLITTFTECAIPNYQYVKLMNKWSFWSFLPSITKFDLINKYIQLFATKRANKYIE